ncbi:hypothetical protein [Burkholderia ambifaria]|uniref:hypothetical protein n=1 Tax=Burkholderia ambifaria TaxID=152480 RepID=UPI0018E09926|nr:hypothetical protein [Burkholderia ambifaria]
MEIQRIVSMRSNRLQRCLRMLSYGVRPHLPRRVKIEQADRASAPGPTYIRMARDFLYLTPGEFRQLNCSTDATEAAPQG